MAYLSNTTNNAVSNAANNTVSNTANNTVSSEANITKGQHRMPDGSMMNDSDMLAITNVPPATTAVKGRDKPIPTISTISPFGFYKSINGVYPNDAVILDVYNGADQYIETNYRVGNYVKEEYKVLLNPEQNLKDLGYISGRYKTTYKFHRNLLGSGDGHKLEIQEISSDGLEIRVLPVITEDDTLDNPSYQAHFGTNFFSLLKAQTLVNLFLFKDANTLIQVFDYVQDKLTVVSPPYSIVFKLNAPAPAGFVIGTELWLAQQVSNPITDSIIIVPPKLKTNKKYIAGPNWDVLAKSNSGNTTQYKSWNNIISTTTDTSNNLISRVLSGSLLEGISLNIDYKEFTNHIHFGSAEERIRNFKYKMQLLEGYNSTIASLSTSIIGSPSSSVTASALYQSSVVNAQNKRTTLIGSLDGYERYLFTESSSYVSNSFGEFYPSTWPKSNTSKPYTVYSTTASQVTDWFDGIITSASLYDQNNSKAIYKLIPAHILESNNEQYVLFTNMIGHYYDLLFNYIKSMTQVTNRDESLLEGFSKDLVYHVAKNLGVDFENGNALEDLWSYTLGTDSTGSLLSVHSITPEDVTKNIWKRIINNLPYLLKTKGTERGIRALINCFGIPQTILRIKEYGGVEPEFDTKTDSVYERFNYALQVGYGGLPSTSTYGSATYGTGSYSSTDPTELIQIPWQQLLRNNTQDTMPMSTQLRVKMALGQTKEQKIMEVPNQWLIKAHQSGTSSYVGFYLSGSQGWATASVSSSIYDGEFHNITLQRASAVDNASNNHDYTLVVKKTKYGKVVTTATASLAITGSVSSSYNTSFITTGSLWIPGSGSFVFAQSESMNIFTGSIQEFRYWADKLTDDILDNHALAPTSYQGNTDNIFTGSTSSFYDLGFRLCLGSDNRKIDYSLTSSFNSQHPNQSKTNFYNGSSLTATFHRLRTPLYQAITEQHSLEWPDLGGNRSVSNKIRIDKTVPGTSVQLRRNTSTERFLSDTNPIDSPRLGIYLSPTNEVNQDIAEQFGGLSIDEFIGDPAHAALDTYPDLEKLQREYNKKYITRNVPQNYIRLLQNYDASLFKLIKKFVPYRANTQVGLVIEPPILNRNKLSTPYPTYEALHYSASLTTISDQISGEVPSVIDYPNQQAIDLSPSFPIGLVMVMIDGTQITKPVTLTGNANEFNDTGIADQLSKSGSLVASLDLGVNQYGRDSRVEGSQYVFMSFATSGSGPTTSLPYRITSSRYDYSEAISPTILDNTRSRKSTATEYTGDIYHSKAFTHVQTYAKGAAAAMTTKYSSSAALYENNWTNYYGLQIVSLYSGTTLQSTPFDTSHYWLLSGSADQGLAFYNNTSGTYTGSAKLPAFYYNAADTNTHELLYEVTISTLESANQTGDPLVELFFGDLDNNLTGSIALSNQTTALSTTFTTLANGPYLGIRIKSKPTSAHSVRIPSLSVKCLNYGAEVQDYHLHDSYGMTNARYDGCKMTSTDWNIDSPDTIDLGPVVTVTVGGGPSLRVSPTTRGNFEIM